MTFRMRGHEEASGVAYVPKHLFEEWAAKDPIARFEQPLLDQGVLTAADRDAIRAAFKAHIDRIADEAYAAPEPESTAERELADVYRSAARRHNREGAMPRRREGDNHDDTTARRHDGDTVAGGFEPSARGRFDHGPAGRRPRAERRYIDAISDGAPHRDAPRSARRPAGPGHRRVRRRLQGHRRLRRGVRQGARAQHADHRVRRLGAAMGLALEGLRPMVEMQFGDFITCGFNQIVNNLAKTHYRWGVGLPIVIRVPVGGGTGAGPFHSQNPEAWFTHVAGLKVVAPATPADAKGLLLAAFDDGNPVLYLEHKFLYRSARGPVPERRRARCRSAGAPGARGARPHDRDLGRRRPAGRSTPPTTLAGRGRRRSRWSTSARCCRGIARRCSPRSRKTVARGRAARGAARPAASAARSPRPSGRTPSTALDAPVTRVAGLDMPVPFSKKLEAIYSPQGRLLPAIRQRPRVLITTTKARRRTNDREGQAASGSHVVSTNRLRGSS